MKSQTLVELSLDVTWVWWGACLIGAASLLFGAFTAILPRHSIALYQWLMARINWHVSPIDETREIRTSRLLGASLILLSLTLLAILIVEKG